MSKLSFKQYYEAKEQLRAAANSNQTVNSEYEMTKYCKFPVLSEDDKEYIALKPKDKVSVVWEYIKEGEELIPTPRRIEISTEEEEGVRVSPAWGKSKLVSWIQKNTIKND